MTALVTLLDYGVGNTASVRRAFERLGATVDFTSDPDRVAAASRIVLPGVGAFAPARERLRATGLDAALRKAVAGRSRLLGLCLGFQLLFEASEEFGRTEGLGFLEGRIKPFSVGTRTPHIGWNQLRTTSSRLLEKVPDQSYVYFVHSFRPEGVEPEDIAAGCGYGGGFAAAIEHGEVWGCQFHPEKSSESGRLLLGNFLKEDAA
jgi:glutamine amidotransferase